MKFEEVLPKLREGYLAKPKRMEVWLYLEEGELKTNKNNIIPSLDKDFILDETWIVKEKKEFTKEEIEVLSKFYDLGFRYICKDGNREITVYDELPDKMLKEGFWYKMGIKMLVVENIPICANMKFSNIKWEDEEPTKIADIIGAKENVKDKR